MRDELSQRFLPRLQLHGQDLAEKVFFIFLRLQKRVQVASDAAFDLPIASHGNEVSVGGEERFENEFIRVHLHLREQPFLTGEKNWLREVLDELCQRVLRVVPHRILIASQQVQHVEEKSADLRLTQALRLNECIDGLERCEDLFKV